MDLHSFKALSFDVYGTLIDWETGIWNALQPLLSVGGAGIGREQALEAFGRIETAQESETPSLRYSTLLAVVHARLAKHWGIAVHSDLHERFGASVPDWPAFPDSAAALGHLKRHFKLVVLSNVDRLSFAASNRKLGVAFDAVYTAEDIGRYKPDPRNFTFLLDRLEQDLGIVRGEVLHVAQSLFHDHVPAERIDLASVWIDRRAGKTGAGATQVPEVTPKVGHRLTSLAAFVEAHRAGLASR
jgi:2-haloalkanoic acid dehalogenase type II